MPLETSPAPETDPGPSVITPKGDRRFAIALLLSGVVCIGMGQTIVFSILPSLGRELGLADIQIAAIFGLSACFWVLSAPHWGRLSDRAGRKPFVLIGLSGFVVSMLLFASSLAAGLAGVVSGLALYALIIFTRSIYGVVGAATPAAAQAYIADRTPPAQRTAGLSAFSAAFGVGAMIGPGFGGVVAEVSPLAPLYAVAALAGVMVTLIFFFLPERSEPLKRAPRPRLRLRDPRLRAFLIFGLATGIINAVPIQSAGFYFIDVLKLDPLEAPRFVGAGLMAGAAASLFAQLVLVQRFRLQPRTLMRAAPCAVLAGHLLIAASSDLLPLVCGLTIAGLGAGMAIPGFTAAGSLAVGPDEQGAAAGLTNSAGATGFVVAPLIGFALYAIAPQAPFLLTSVMAAGLIAYAWSNGAIRAATGVRT